MSLSSILSNLTLLSSVSIANFEQVNLCSVNIFQEQILQQKHRQEKDGGSI